MSNSSDCNTCDNSSCIQPSPDTSGISVSNIDPHATCRLCNKLLEGIEGSPYRSSGGKNRTCGSCMKGFYPGCHRDWCNIM